MKNIAFFALIVLFAFNFGHAQKYKLKNIKLNDELSHYGVAYQNGNTVYYSSYKYNNFGSIDRNRMGQLIFTVYEGTFDEDGEITKTKEFKASDKFTFNSSTASFSADKTYMYVTTNEEKRGDVYKHDDKTRNLRIERGEYIEGKGYGKFEPLPFCDPNYSYAHATVSPNGDYLYFVSNIPSAKGPTDLFRVQIQGNNKYGDIENLGDDINSPRRETFPTISADNVLYFSSDRAGGIGGLDIYKVEIDSEGKLGLPKLMPQPINSRGDDMCLTFNSDGTKGYLTSNRGKGKGEDDIYYFVIE